MVRGLPAVAFLAGLASAQQERPALPTAERTTLFQAANAVAKNTGTSILVASGLRGEVMLPPDADVAALQAALAPSQCVAWQDEFGVITIGRRPESGAEGPFSFALTGKPYAVALLQVAARTEVDVVARLPDRARVPAEIAAEHGHAAVRRLLLASAGEGWVAFQRGGVLVATPRAPAASAGLRLAFDGHDAAEVVKLLARVSGRPIRLDASFGGDVGILAQGTPVDRILVAIAAAADGVVRRDRQGTLLVRSIAGDAEPVTLKVARATLAEIAEMLAGASGRRIEAARQLAGVTLFCHLGGTPRASALAAIAAAAGATVVELGDGGVRFEPAP